MDITIKNLRQAAEAIRNGVRVELTSFAYDDAADDLERQRKGLRQIAGLLPDKTMIPLDRAFATVREMAKVANDTLKE